MSYNFLPVYSGPSWHLASRLEYLSKNAFTGDLITARRADFQHLPLNGEFGSFRIHRIPQGGSSLKKQIGSALTLARKSIQLTRGKSLIHVIGIDLFTLVPMLIGYLRGIPVIAELQLIGNDDPLAIQKRKLGGLRYALLKRVSTIIVISPAQRDLCKQAGIPPDKILLIPIGADTSVFCPVTSLDERTKLREKLGLPLKSIILVSGGRVSERKGSDFLVRCLTRLLQAGHKVSLLWVGPLKKSEKELTSPFVQSLLKEVDAARISDHLIITGHVSRNVVADYLRASDIFVFASKNEGLGVIQIEAMTCGLPSVVTYLPGITEELFNDGDDAYVVKNRDLKSFCDRVKTLIQRPELRRQFGLKASEKGKARFDEVVLMHNYIELYNRLVAQGIAIHS